MPQEKGRRRAGIKARPDIARTASGLDVENGDDLEASCGSITMIWSRTRNELIAAPFRIDRHHFRRKRDGSVTPRAERGCRPTIVEVHVGRPARRARSRITVVILVRCSVEILAPAPAWPVVACDAVIGAALGFRVHLAVVTAFAGLRVRLAVVHLAVVAAFGLHVAVLALAGLRPSCPCRPWSRSGRSRPSTSDPERLPAARWPLAAPGGRSDGVGHAGRGLRAQRSAWSRRRWIATRGRRPLCVRLRRFAATGSLRAGRAGCRRSAQSRRPKSRND